MGQIRRFTERISCQFLKYQESQRAFKPDEIDDKYVINFLHVTVYLLDIYVTLIAKIHRYRL